MDILWFTVYIYGLEWVFFSLFVGLVWVFFPRETQYMRNAPLGQISDSPRTLPGLWRWQEILFRESVWTWPLSVVHSPLNFPSNHSYYIWGATGHIPAYTFWYPCVNLLSMNLSRTFLSLLTLSGSTPSCGKKVQKFTTLCAKVRFYKSVLNGPPTRFIKYSQPQFLVLWGLVNISIFLFYLLSPWFYRLDHIQPQSSLQRGEY